MTLKQYPQYTIRQLNHAGRLARILRLYDIWWEVEGRTIQEHPVIFPHTITKRPQEQIGPNAW